MLCIRCCRSCKLPISDFTDCEIGGGSVQSFPSGNNDLEEEEGENYQLGLVWQVNNNTSFSIDLYEVTLENAVERKLDTLLTMLKVNVLMGNSF